MPLNHTEWENAEEVRSETPIAVIYDFLSDHPGTAYNMEEIAGATGLFNQGVGSKIEPFEAEATSEQGPEGLIGTVYFMLMLSILVELGKVEVRVQEEPSDVMPRGERGVKYYRARAD